MSDFLSGELEAILPRVYARRYPELWGITGEVIPLINNPDLPYLERIKANYTDVAGQAKLVAESGDDIPLVSTDASQDEFKAFTAWLGAHWNNFDEGKAQRVGRNIIEQRVMGIRRGLDEKCHKMAVFGAPNHTGLLNSTTVPVLNPSLDLDNAGTTADDLISFFTTLMKTLRDQSNYVESGNITIMMPPSIHYLISTKMRANTDKTVLMHLMDNFTDPMSAGALQRIIAKPELEASYLEANGVKAPGTNKDMIMLMAANPDAIAMQFSGFFQFPLAMNSTGTGYTQVYYRAQSEVMFLYPKAALYVNVDTVP